MIPQETTATELVLFRHFAAARGEIEVAIASDHPDTLLCPNGIPILPNPLLLRLTKTRLALVAHSLRHWPITFDSHALRDYLREYQPDGIITVAPGELYQLARKTAQQLNVPLITFFHDWLPDLAWVPDSFRPFLTHRFHKLYQQSQLAFCVSKEIQEQLGEHPHSVVLPPIPEHLLASTTSSSSAAYNLNRERFDGIVEHRASHYPILKHESNSAAPLPFTLVYAGNLSDDYGYLVQQLGMVLRSHSDLKLQLFGQTPNWPEDVIQQFKNWGVYSGFLPRSSLLKEFSKARALLVVMSFDPRHRRRMETSFPSKLVEYCQFGKPIVIWGPEYCSAVQWARHYEAAEIVTSPDTKALIRALYCLSKQKEKQKQLGEQVRKLAVELFSPEQIQQQFMDALRMTIKSQSNPLLLKR